MLISLANKRISLKKALFIVNEQNNFNACNNLRCSWKADSVIGSVAVILNAKKIPVTRCFSSVSLVPLRTRKVVFIISLCFPPNFLFCTEHNNPNHKYAYAGGSHRERKSKIKGLLYSGSLAV